MWWGLDQEQVVVILIMLIIPASAKGNIVARLFIVIVVRLTVILAVDLVVA